MTRISTFRAALAALSMALALPMAASAAELTFTNTTDGATTGRPAAMYSKIFSGDQ